MTNTQLQKRYGWHPLWARGVIGVSPLVRIDSPYFADMVKVYQSRTFLPVDGLMGSKTYGVMRVREREPSLSDIEWLARVITAEAGAGNDIEQMCVAYTLINRILTAPTRYGASVERVARSRAYASRSRSPSYRYTGRAKAASLHILCDRPEDPTHGATHFYSPCNMPPELAPRWPGADKARHRRYYRGGGRYFLWDAERQRKQFTSTSGGWEPVTDGDGVTTVRSRPGWARRMELCDVPGVREWRFRFYRPH